MFGILVPKILEAFSFDTCRINIDLFEELYQKILFLLNLILFMPKKNSCNLQIRSQNVTNFFQKLIVEMTPKVFWEFFRTILMIRKNFGRLRREKKKLWHFAQKVAQNFVNFGKNTIFLKFLESLEIGRYHKSAEYFFERSAQIPRILTVKILRFR